MEKTKDVMAIAEEFFKVCMYTEENDERIESKEWDEISKKLDELENRYYEASARDRWEEIGIEGSEIDKYIKLGYKKREFIDELVKLYEDNYSPTR